MEPPGPSPSSKNNRIRGANSLQWTRGSNLTSKMAGPVHISPLLRPRPDFLGVGKGCGHLSIFSELLKLSGLSNFISGHSFSKTQTRDLTDDLEDSTQEKTTKLIANGYHHKHEKQGANDSSNSVKSHSYQVFELDSNGKPETLTEYQLNDKTLHLFNTLTSLKIPFRTEIYRPKEHRLNVDSSVFYCKNLFLKDRKGALFLVICHEDINADLKKLRRDLKAYRNFNFATQQDMELLLGVEPGGVTPLALMNNEASDVSMVICKSLQKESATLMFHPMDLNLAIEITMTDLLRFLKYFKRPVKFLKSS